MSVYYQNRKNKTFLSEDKYFALVEKEFDKIDAFVGKFINIPFCEKLDARVKIFISTFAIRNFERKYKMVEM